MKRFFGFCREHYLVILMAAIVGLIYIAPNLFFIFSLGNQYRGIPMMQTANEDFYLARVQEILDGHPGLGSFAFYEDKQQASLTPPVGEMFYALPSLLFHISLINILIASRFILPFIIFILIYFLIHKLTASAGLLSNKINAVAGALLVTLGYDLVDYHTAWLFLTGKISGGYFLLWSRPVNPVMGGIFLFSFLLCLWLIISQSRYCKTLMVLAALFLALMFGSYFFSWGIAVSVWALLIAVYLIDKRYALVKSLAMILPGALILTSPQWYFLWQASKSSWYEDTLLRNGLFYTHYPLWNKVLLAALAIYAISAVFLFWRRKTLSLWAERIAECSSNIGLQNWFIFCLALLLGGFVALNQQLVTGRTVWPFHFVQYTIPLAMLAMCVLFYNLVREKWPRVWGAIIAVLIISALGWGVFAQAKAYIKYYDYYVGLQSYQSVFDWLNQQPKDCVVLTFDEPAGFYNLNGLIPAFTHCNVYASTWAAFTILRPERVYYSYLTLLRLKGVTADEIDNYINQNRQEAAGYLFSNWKGLYGIKQFPDFSDRLLGERIKKFPEDYREFYAEDFRQALSKYRLDFILTLGPLRSEVIQQLSGLKLIQQYSDVYIYAFAK